MPSRSAPDWQDRTNIEVHRGNGIGVVLAGVAVLTLVGALLTPWWAYSYLERGDRVDLALYPGATYVETCLGQNCTVGWAEYTYSSMGLGQTGSVLEEVDRALGAVLFVGVACFLAAMISWVDRARLGAVRTTIVAAAVAGVSSLGAPIWMFGVLPGALAADTAGVSGAENLGALGGWILSFIAAALFFGTAVSEWTTVKYAKPWDAPLSMGRPSSTGEGPPVTAPPDRIRRIQLLRQSGAISENDFEAQKQRILSPNRLVGPVPIPPNAGSREAARAHIEYLRGSGQYTPDELEVQKENVLRVYGLSSDFRFPEEEMAALAIRRRGGVISQDEFERRKKEILDRI